MIKFLNCEIQCRPDIPQIESDINSFWQRANTFEKSVGKGGDNWVFYDGPPFANGLPHYGHLLTGYVKDSFPRYHTMRGERVERQFGWDCHGLPAEIAAEKILGVAGRRQILETVGVEKFNDTCKDLAFEYAHKWEDYITRQGRWVDFKNAYRTMDKDYMESVIFAFYKLYEMGLVYEDYKVMLYSWACQTGLSNFETRMDNSYRQKESQSIYVRFTLKEVPEPIKKIMGECERCVMVVWTTTPWTLPSNLVLMVNADVDYQLLKREGDVYVLCNPQKLQRELANPDQDLGLLPCIKGRELLGCSYIPMFNYFSDRRGFFIIHSDSVSKEEGTGVVHCAPGFGEEDFAEAKKHGVALVCPVDESGKFTSEVWDLEGAQVFDANDKIIAKLKAKGDWIKTEQHFHNYPHCWRTDTPLIFKAMSSWYVKASQLSKRMCELNENINWIPKHVKEGMFGNWLANAKDWSISRTRLFGTPIPVWKSDDPRYPRIDVYGSIKQMEKDFGVQIPDLHLPFLDQLVRPNPDDPTGKSVMRRVDGVLDCWFESGAMPFASVHYPFDTDTHSGPLGKNILDIDTKRYPPYRMPADFIVEYVAQTRGWFYTLMVLSTALFDSIPFRNCICHGVVLSEANVKLSKRLGNYADPLEMINKYGSDSLRYLLLQSPLLSGGNLAIGTDDELFKESLRNKILPIYNSYVFFMSYAGVYEGEVRERLEFESEFDKFIIYRLKTFVDVVDRALDSYNISGAYDEIDRFIETLNNWFIRRNRKRFLQGDQDAFDALYTVLINFSKAAAPCLPFLCEYLYKNLTRSMEDDKVSVHLCVFPEIVINEQEEAGMEVILERMEFAQAVCKAAHSIRARFDIRARQPLSELKIIGDLPLDESLAAVICEEVNVKKIRSIEEVYDYASLKPKLNFSLLGKRIPNKVKEVMKGINEAQKVEGGFMVGEEFVCDTELEMILEPKDKKASEVLNRYKYIVMLDTEVGDDLIREGLARDLVRSIQNIRQRKGLRRNQAIDLYLDTDVQIIREACAENKDMIRNNTGASEVYVGSQVADMEEVDIEGNIVRLAVVDLP